MSEMDEMRAILQQVQDGRISLEDALQALRGMTSEALGYANLDHQRQSRTGIPEVIFGDGKTAEQVLAIFRRMAERTSPVLATRVTRGMYRQIQNDLPAGCVYHEVANLVYLDREPAPRKPGVLLVTAGTSDIPVAEEAGITAELMGCQVERIFDVGVAGLHRLINHLPALRAARVIIAVAGMEGALPSVVGGLVACPVIAVPTSVGYGASFNGLAALLAMLNACAPGVGVVNIDNGFGAGCLAARINHMEA
ncbi:MAG: nickel pincer cofactor biosynthesis protein LarB [Anaerolineae bacterium]|nr:nickel pincer cofactor biosynthesis protein LarB [Anaerolineae bacterium]